MNEKYLHYRQSTRKWAVCVQAHGIKNYCGCYATKEEAIAVRNRELMALDGDLSRLEVFDKDRKRLSQEQVDEVLRLRNKGFGYKAIQEIMGITKGQVDQSYRRIKKAKKEAEKKEKGTTMMEDILYSNRYFHAA